MQWAPSSPWLSFDPKQFSIEPKTLILCWFGSGVATAVVPHNLTERKRQKTESKTIAGFIEPMLCLAVEKLPEGPAWQYEVKLDGYRAIAVSHRKLDVPFASLAISVISARTLRSPIVGIGTELLAHREKIEVTRHRSPCARSPVPVARAHRHCTRAVCALPRRMPQT